VRTQDLETWFEEHSNLYIFNNQSFQSTNARIGKKPVMFETPLKESVDIDDKEGWEIAELLAKAGMYNL
jgi:CMP-N-acetylneuraminic acid synthetase